MSHIRLVFAFNWHVFGMSFVSPKKAPQWSSANASSIFHQQQDVSSHFPAFDTQKTSTWVAQSKAEPTYTQHNSRMKSWTMIIRSGEGRRQDRNAFGITYSMIDKVKMRVRVEKNNVCFDWEKLGRGEGEVWKLKVWVRQAGAYEMMKFNLNCLTFLGHFTCFIRQLTDCSC